MGDFPTEGSYYLAGQVPFNTRYAQCGSSKRYLQKVVRCFPEGSASDFAYSGKLSGIHILVEPVVRSTRLLLFSPRDPFPSLALGRSEL